MGHRSVYPAERNADVPAYSRKGAEPPRRKAA